MHDILEHFISVLLVEGRKSKHHFIKQGSHAIEINSSVMAAFQNHFRRHISNFLINTQRTRKKSKHVRQSLKILTIRNPLFSNSHSGPAKRFQVLSLGKLFCCDANKTLLNKFIWNINVRLLMTMFSLISNG